MWEYLLILALFLGKIFSESLGFFSQGALSLFNGPPTGFNQPQNGDDFTLYNNLQGFDGPPTLYLPFGYFGISRYFTGMDQRNDGNNDFFIGQYSQFNDQTFFNGKPIGPAIVPQFNGQMSGNQQPQSFIGQIGFGNGNGFSRFDRRKKRDNQKKWV